MAATALKVTFWLTVAMTFVLFVIWGHEFRTPLTLLSTRAQLLSHRHRDDLPPDVAASLDEMMRDSRTVTEILDDLLIAAVPRSGTVDDAVDLVSTADAVIVSMRDHADVQKIALGRHFR